jgi:Flp pilus assembly protein TadG
MRAPVPLRQLKVDDVPGDPARVHGDAGAALVEFALVAPLLFMLIFGIYAFALGYNAKVEITGAAREGARAVALRQTAPPLADVVKAAAPGLTPAPAVVVDESCPVDPMPGTNARVTVTHPFTYSVPFLPKRTVTITAKGVMRCGL